MTVTRIFEYDAPPRLGLSAECAHHIRRFPPGSLLQPPPASMYALSRPRPDTRMSPWPAALSETTRSCEARRQLTSRPPVRSRLTLAQTARLHTHAGGDS